MAQTNRNRLFMRVVGKRDKAYVRMEFNKSRLLVIDAQIGQKQAKDMQKQTLLARKRLYPLELAALSQADRNKALIECEMTIHRAKQSLQRRAVQQTYLRATEKGEKAEAARDAALNALDRRLTEKEAALTARYGGTDKTADKQAAEVYGERSKTEQTRLSALAEEHAKQKKRTLDTLGGKLEAQNGKLQARFREAEAQILSMCPTDPASFGEDSILNIQNLKMYFSGIKAVDDLSIRVRRGEIFGLIGPNGAGKTTLFNCITQFYKPKSGDIYYRDRFGSLVNLVHYNTHDVIRAGISRTFQNVELVYFLSVIDNLMLGAHASISSGLFSQILRTKRYKDEEAVFRSRAMELLSRLGIAAYAEAYPLGLPYGVLKKIELARTLMSNPRMIILDEPAAGLNESETEELGRIIRSVRDDFDCTVFLVEHDMNLVMGICDTVCAISFGKMLAVGTPEEIQGNPVVQEAYLGVE
ncbi:MAG: ATP-binding cassette domain-containing protein [Oscillospiraceae bacterium]|jgi:branched-chain amino acid transport system ATP-binding protein|nr:ATP-binding cassette domain-containing protein [Oscillospiraceae bacterium]